MEWSGVGWSGGEFVFDGILVIATDTRRVHNLPPANDCVSATTDLPKKPWIEWTGWMNGWMNDCAAIVRSQPAPPRPSHPKHRCSAGDPRGEKPFISGYVVPMLLLYSTVQWLAAKSYFLFFLLCENIIGCEIRYRGR